MRIMGIDPNSKHIAWVIMDDEFKIIEKGVHEITGMTFFLDGKVKDHNLKGIACEGFHYYGNVKTNQYHFMTIEVIGMLYQYSLMRGLMFWKYDRPTINLALSGSSKTKEGAMQDVIRKHLGLEKPIRPEHVSAATCVAYYVHKEVMRYDNAC